MQVKNYSYFVGEDQVQNRHHSVSEGKNGKAKNGGKSIDARSMASVTDPVAAKRAQAQKKAMKIIGDAFAGESKIDDDMANRREKIRSLTREKCCFLHFFVAINVIIFTKKGNLFILRRIAFLNICIRLFHTFSDYHEPSVLHLIGTAGQR